MKNLACAVGVMLVACTKADIDELSTAKVTEGTISARPVSAAPPSALELRVRELAECSLEGTQIASMCPALQRLREEPEQRLSPDAAARLMAHPSPAVRLEAAALSANRTAVVAAAHRERDAQVRRAMVRLVDDASTFVTDADVGVRAEAVAHLAARPGSAAALAQVIESDASPELRADACRLAREPSLLPLYERLTHSGTLQTACMEGLAEQVFSDVGAYKLFLRRVGEGVRPWTVMSTFCNYDPATKPAWFDVAEVIAVMSAAADTATDSKARDAAVESLVGLRAPRYTDRSR